MISNGTVHSIGPRLVFSFLLTLLLVLLGVQAAQAEPQDLSAAKSQAAVLEAQFKELKDQARVLQNKYAAASAELAQIESDAVKNATLLIKAQQDQLSTESALMGRLADIYKQGRTGSLAVLLSSSSWTQLLQRVELLERISQQDAGLLKQVTGYRAQVIDQGSRLAAQLEKQEAAAKQVEIARQAMDQKLAQSRQTLQSKQTEVVALEKAWQAEQERRAQEERERQAKLEEELAKAQAAAQEAEEDAGEEDGGNGGSASTTSTTSAHTTTTAGGGTGTHHQGVSNVLKPEQIALAAQKAGFSGQNLVIAVAVALAESGGNANAVGRLRTYGLWQILSSAHPDMIRPSDPDASKWYDAYVNARFAFKISSKGTNWRPWSVYKSGSYLNKMAKAQAGVDKLLSDPGSITPPGVK